MADYSLYKKRIGLYGDNLRDSNVELFKSQYQSLAVNSPSYKRIYIDGSEDSTGALIISKQEGTKKTIAIVDDNVSINLGSKIIWNNIDWLVVEKDTDEDVYVRGTIKQCNYKLPFQIESSEVYYEPCIVDDKTTLDTGEKEGKIISIPDTRRVVKLQYNERTAQLHEGKRIFIDMPFENANVYKITEINRVTEMQGDKGIWVLKCDEDHLNKNTDRPDLLIADYITPDDNPDPDPSPTDYECEIIYSGTPEIKVGGSAKTFTAKFYDADGNEIFDVEPIWNINDNYGGAVQIKDQFDNKIKIQVASVSGLVGKSFELALRDVDGLYETKLEVRMVPMV